MSKLILKYVFDLCQHDADLNERNAIRVLKHSDKHPFSLMMLTPEEDRTLTFIRTNYQ